MLLPEYFSKWYSSFDKKLLYYHTITDQIGSIPPITDMHGFVYLHAYAYADTQDSALSDEFSGKIIT
jgi:hypothetical protein